MIADECKKTEESYIIKDLKKKLGEIETAINNLFKALEYGTASELVLARLEERQKDKADLEKELAIEKTKNTILTEDEITAFLTYISTQPVTDIKQKKALINIFVHSVYLYDDHFNLILNGSNKRLNIDNIPITYIDAALENKEPIHGSSVKSLVSGLFYYIRYFAHEHSVYKDIHAGKKFFSFHRLRIGNQRKNRYNNTGYYLYKKEKRFDDVLYAKYY